MPLLELHDVEARYGQITALHGVSLEVGEGEIVAVLGANGAGKTTIARKPNERGLVFLSPAARSSTTTTSATASSARQCAAPGWPASASTTSRTPTPR